MKTLLQLLENNWIPINETPKYFSFRCILKFDELGLNGYPHISTGYWWHLQNGFSVDDKEMKKLHITHFIPIYNHLFEEEK